MNAIWVAQYLVAFKKAGLSWCTSTEVRRRLKLALLGYVLPVGCPLA